MHLNRECVRYSEVQFFIEAFCCYCWFCLFLLVFLLLIFRLFKEICADSSSNDIGFLADGTWYPISSNQRKLSCI